jgi:hypothetical protein
MAALDQTIVASAIWVVAEPPPVPSARAEPEIVN